MPLRPSAARRDLLRVFAQLIVDDPAPQPLAFALIDNPDGSLDLALRALPATDPIGALYGFRAPDDWRSFGVAAWGRAHRPDGDTMGDVRVVHLVDRDGTEVNLARGDGLRVDDDVAVGRVPELCRRVLGLPTAPATAPLTLLWQLDWLDRVLAHVLDRDLGAPAPGLAELVALDRGPTELADPWPILRRRCAAGSLSLAGIGASLAAWMDDGLFSREVLAAYPDRAELLADLGELVLPATLRAIRRRLGGCTP